MPEKLTGLEGIRAPRALSAWPCGSSLTPLRQRDPLLGPIADDDVIVQAEVEELRGLGELPADLGVAKAAIVAPAVERLGQWRTWLTWAIQLSAVALQAKVSEALQALPRGVELSPPGTRFRQTVLAAMPDIEAMELVERFFEVGTLGRRHGSHTWAFPGFMRLAG